MVTVPETVEPVNDKPVGNGWALTVLYVSPVPVPVKGKDTAMLVLLDFPPPVHESVGPALTVTGHVTVFEATLFESVTKATSDDVPATVPLSAATTPAVLVNGNAGVLVSDPIWLNENVEYVPLPCVGVGKVTDLVLPIDTTMDAGHKMDGLALTLMLQHVDAVAAIDAASVTWKHTATVVVATVGCPVSVAPEKVSPFPV